MRTPLLFACLAATAPAFAQHPTAGEPGTKTQSADPKAAMYVAPRDPSAQDATAAMQLGPGMQAQLAASEPDLCNVVAFCFDDQGRVYVSETFRIQDGVFDTREYMRWKDEDLACLTVADRLAKYERHIADAIPKYAAYSERVKLLLDDDKDFTFDRSMVFADGFAALEDGIASGVLPIGGDVWFTNIPKLWRLRDQDGDGSAERREAVFDGFGVHTSLIGHDLHGLVLGPDRRLYFSIGDRGFSTRTKEGGLLDFPHEGAVLRCELDGSGLEVVHRGLRNPQELCFDDRGNLFTGDNNSDGGDRARLVQIQEGGDSGWRIGFQWLSDRGAWNREGMWRPQEQDSPAATALPVLNLADGPSGLCFDPGHGLPDRYRDCFFLCDFRGGASYSGVHAFRLAPHGAGFELVWRDRPVWNVLATDVDFSPDGALYVSDWVSGWGKTGKGRLFRIEQPGQKNAMSARQTARLLGEGFEQKSTTELAKLLRHLDRRVRQKAQFALVDRDARDVLLAAAKDQDAGKARLCGVFGLGAIARKDASAAEPLLALCDDGDSDVRAMAARALGDSGLDKARPKLLQLLKDHVLFVQREAALALARHRTNLGERAVEALLDAAAANDDRDPVLRRAFAQALGAAMGARGQARRGEAVATDRRQQAFLDRTLRHEHKAVRLCALLALRAARSPHCAAFLEDQDAAVRREAARAIYDEDIQAAMPALAAALQSRSADDAPFGWRAANAARLLGQPAHAAGLLSFAADGARPLGLRLECVRILAEWRAPHGQDRVLGNWRPAARSDADLAAATVGPQLLGLLGAEADLAQAAAKACESLRPDGADAALRQAAQDRARTGPVRVSALRALAALGGEGLDEAVAAITKDDPTELRTAAVELFAERNPKAAAAVLATLCEQAETKERQAAFAALGTLRDPAADAILAVWMRRLLAGEVDAAVQLDLQLAAAQRSAPELQGLCKSYDEKADPQDPLAPFAACLEGGDAAAGKRVFLDHEATRCTRCHMVGGSGGNAGPKLDGIGARQDAAYLLESLIVPSAKIAPGFATTVLTLHNGDLLAGVLTRDQDGEVEITDIQGDSKKVPAARIKERRTAKDSAMPAMGQNLDRRQIRDLIAYLQSLKSAGK